MASRSCNLDIEALVEGSKKGSIDDLHKLAKWSGNWPTPQPQYFGFFCHHLDRAMIPSKPVLQSGNFRVVKLAQLSLQGVLSTVRDVQLIRDDDPLVQALTESWTGIWGWVNFLHSLFFQKPTSSNLDLIKKNVIEADLEFIVESYVTNFLLLSALSKQERLREQLALTPGFFPLVTSTWVKDLRDNILPDGPLLASRTLCHFVENPHWVNEIIAAAGGDPAEVAQVALQHLRDLKFSEDADYDAFGCDILVVEGLSLTHEAIGNALAAQNAVMFVTVSIITLTARPYTPATSDNITRCLAGCFLYLETFLDGGLTSVIQAIESTLIQGILLSDPWVSDGYPAALCTKILQEIIPGYLAYRSVLRVVGRAMKKVRSNGLEQRLRQGGYIWKAWMAFKGVAENRLAFKDLWDAGMSHMPCSNPECSKVGDEDSFMRCSGCQEAFYCDRRCQKADWKINHREICKITQVYRKKVPLKMPSRDLAFLSALTRHEIYRQRGYIRDVSWSDSQNLSDRELDVIYVDFNLVSKGRSSVIIGPPDSLRPVDYVTNEEIRILWDKLVDRARSSHGELTLVLTGIAQGLSRQEYYALAPLTGVFRPKPGTAGNDISEPLSVEEEIGSLNLTELQLVLGRGIHQLNRREGRQSALSIVTGNISRRW